MTNVRVVVFAAAHVMLTPHPLSLCPVTSFVFGFFLPLDGKISPVSPKSLLLFRIVATVATSDLADWLWPHLPICRSLLMVDMYTTCYGKQRAGIMARHFAVLACMAAVVTTATAASLGPASAPSMLKLRSNLSNQRDIKLIPKKADSAEYFTTPVDKDEEMLCLRMRSSPIQSKVQCSRYFLY